MTKNGHWLESATVKPEPAEILQSGSSPSDPRGGVARRDATRAASSAIRRSRPRILQTALCARFRVSAGYSLFCAAPVQSPSPDPSSFPRPCVKIGRG